MRFPRCSEFPNLFASLVQTLCPKGENFYERIKPWSEKSGLNVVSQGAGVDPESASCGCQKCTWKPLENLWGIPSCKHNEGKPFAHLIFTKCGLPFVQRKPRVRKMFVRNSGAGNGCVNFMDAWKNAFFLQEKPMSIKFLVLGGGGWVFFWGGSADFIFMGARTFLICDVCLVCHVEMR